MKINSGDIFYLSMVTRVCFLCVNNTLVVIMNEAFDEFITDVKNRKAVCDALVQKLQTGTHGITLQGAAVKHEAALYFSACASFCGAYGYSINDGKLMDMVSQYNESNLLHTKIEELPDSIAKILAVVDLYKVPLVKFGVTPAFDLKLRSIQTDLIASQNGSKNQIDIHKGDLEALEEQIKQLRLLFANSGDLTAKAFKFINMEFYKAYKSARMVPHYHIHNKVPTPPDVTTGDAVISLMDKITGQAVPNITLTIMAINFTAVSDVNGQIPVKNLLPAIYSATLKGDNINTLEFNFEVKIGQVTDLGFILEAITTTTV